MITSLRAVVGLLVLTVVCFLLVAACDDDDAKRSKTQQSDAQQQAQLLTQLQAEQNQRLRAEENIRAVEQSRSAWITGICAGAAVACVLLLLTGIHIGSRPHQRSDQERQHE